MKVRAKKYLGQHFLTDRNIAQKIVHSLSLDGAPVSVLEVGPGMGVLTDFMLEEPKIDLYVVDIDQESIDYLKQKYPALNGRIHSGDFLKLDLSQFKGPGGKLTVIGNFPYNISSQILFHVIDNRAIVSEVVGMFQKEVAERIAAKPGSKAYGILSVMMQAYFDVQYLFSVGSGVFNPPPKVKSAVIKGIRKKEDMMKGADEKLFGKVVKAAFNQRRKTLRNALSMYIRPEFKDLEIFDLRAEKLTVSDFVYLTTLFSGESQKAG